MPDSDYSTYLLQQYYFSRWRGAGKWNLPVAAEPDAFHVFLCHNTADKPEVRWTARRLQERDIRPWLDEDQLRPGQSWQEELERQIGSIGAAAVFVGPNGIGPWQNREIRAFLSEFVTRSCPVIPVLLPGAEIPAALPIFLRGMTWVDLRKRSAAAIELLIWGITGHRLYTACASRAECGRTDFLGPAVVKCSYSRYPPLVCASRASARSSCVDSHVWGLFRALCGFHKPLPETRSHAALSLIWP